MKMKFTLCHKLVGVQYDQDSAEITEFGITIPAPADYLSENIVKGIALNAIRMLYLNFPTEKSWMSVENIAESENLYKDSKSICVYRNKLLQDIPRDLDSTLNISFYLEDLKDNQATFSYMIHPVRNHEAPSRPPFTPPCDDCAKSDWKLSEFKITSPKFKISKDSIRLLLPNYDILLGTDLGPTISSRKLILPENKE